jgi:hypothetical protein
MNAYSYWEQGRDLSSGQIISMTPIDLSSGGDSLGSITLAEGGLALSAIAQFGIFLEMRRMNKLKEAEFEERRHAWINEITIQWIEEHKNSTGILGDITLAVSRECGKMWEKVCENDKVDVPQVVLLRLARLTEFLEWNYFLAAFASNYIVEASGSDKGWLLEPNVSSEAIAIDLLRQANDETRGNWWQSLLKTLGGLPLFFIPIFGPVAGGGAVGYGIGEMIGRFSMTEANFEVLRDKLPLLQFGIAASYLDVAVNHLTYLLEQQEFTKPVRYIALETGVREVRFLLDRVNKGWRRTSKVSLKPVPVPPGAS